MPSGTFSRAERLVKLQGPLQSQEASPAAPISRGDLKNVSGPLRYVQRLYQPRVMDAELFSDEQLAL